MLIFGIGLQQPGSIFLYLLSSFNIKNDASVKWQTAVDVVPMYLIPDNNKVILLTCCGRHFSREVTPQTPTRNPGLILRGTSINIRFNPTFFVLVCCVFLVPVIYAAPLAAVSQLAGKLPHSSSRTRRRALARWYAFIVSSQFSHGRIFRGFSGGGALDLNSTLLHF